MTSQIDKTLEEGRSQVADGLVVLARQGCWQQIAALSKLAYKRDDNDHFRKVLVEKASTPDTIALYCGTTTRIGHVRIPAFPGIVDLMDKYLSLDNPANDNTDKDYGLILSVDSISEAVRQFKVNKKTNPSMFIRDYKIRASSGYEVADLVFDTAKGSETNKMPGLLKKNSALANVVISFNADELVTLFRSIKKYYGEHQQVHINVHKGETVLCVFDNGVELVKFLHSAKPQHISTGEPVESLYQPLIADTYIPVLSFFGKENIELRFNSDSNFSVVHVVSTSSGFPKEALVAPARHIPGENLSWPIFKEKLASSDSEENVTATV